MVEIEPREFRVAAVYRYLFLAYALIVLMFALQYWTMLFDPDQSADVDRKDWLIPAFFSSFAVVPIFLSIVAFRWRLRMDSEGIHRRRLQRWDLWPWTAFQSGGVYVASFPLSYWFPTKPWGRRGLVVEQLSREAADCVRETIEFFWVPPPSPEVPNELKIVYPKDFKFSPAREEVRFDAEGIEVRRRNRRWSYRWEDVRSLDLRRPHHDQPDFEVLKLRLPGRTMWFAATEFLGGRSRNWTGASPEQLAGVLVNYVPSERVVFTATRGLPKDAEEYARRLRRMRTFRWVLIVAAVFFAALSTFPMRKIIDHAIKMVSQPSFPLWARLEIAFTLGSAMFTVVLSILLPGMFFFWYRYLSFQSEARVLARWRARAADAIDENS